MATPTITQALKSALPPIRTTFLDNRGNITQPWVTWMQSLVNKLNPVMPQCLAGSHAARTNISAGDYPSGTIYHETDRNLWYIVQNAAWIYKCGIYQVTQANIPSDFGTNDTGLLLYVTDYAHELIWNGNSFTWAPGEQGSGFTLTFLVDPSPTDGWHACDGSNVLQMLSDGTMNPNFVTVPNSAGVWFRQ